MELYHKRLEIHMDRMAGRRSVVRSVHYGSEASVRQRIIYLLKEVPEEEQ